MTYYRVKHLDPSNDMINNEEVLQPKSKYETPKLVVKTERKISSCQRCNGMGYIERSELVCYQKGDYDYWNELCSDCSGSGLIEMIVKTTEIKNSVKYVLQRGISREDFLKEKDLKDGK